MHVGLDLHFLSGRAGGVETYVAELVPALQRADPGLRLTAFLPRAMDPPDWLSGVEPVVAGVPGPARPAMLMAQASRLPLLARRHKVDLVHSPANFAPRLGGTPVVVTVHDLLHRRRPDLVPPLTRAVVQVFVDGAARRARRVLTVSEASAADIVRYVGRTPADVDVTPPAARPVRRPDAEDLVQPLRPQLLSVGNSRPHKNLDLLLGALSRIDPPRRPLLVLPGSGLDAALGERVRSLRLCDDVRFPGWVSDHELERLYATSTAYVCPSLFEGFGLPVLEAMLRGLPVACSDLPVLREVAGGAARYFDPTSEPAAAAAISSLVDDPAAAADLGALGLRRAEDFSWERTAELTLASYARALG
jgi:glycosyltransferase involved in cell wall biosynthesis